MDTEQFVKIAKALSEETRLAMLRAIASAEELTCSCLCERFPLSQPTISHHLKILQSAGLITVEKQGLFHRLRVNEGALKGFSLEVPGVMRGGRARGAKVAISAGAGPSSPGGAKAGGTRKAPGRGIKKR
ncbi:MAG: helix-turn-helix transcriptional regulator [Phycisphaerales bacterium]|nr:helix-turn-helix transcriptional regulator [Phycisphaerales bacterium]